MDRTNNTPRGPASLAGALAPAIAGALLAGCASTQTPSHISGDERGVPSAPVADRAAPASLPPSAPAQAAIYDPAPVVEPAPAAVAVVPAQPALSAADTAAPAATRDLWDRMRAGFAMPEMNTALVAEKERYYLQKPENLRRMFERGGRYLYFIMEEVEKRGMPAELALLPFVESAMNPRALSPAQAAGLWQFIPSTGKQYNLSQNWWVDNRRDVVHSTHAALEYLQKIYAMQGNDWFLALASYNWGEGSVQRAMRKNAARGRPTDYLSLSMPDETRHYVPKLMALRNIVMRADELGIKLPPLPNKPYFVTVEKTRPIDLKLAARFAGMSVDEFVALNPAHNRPVIAANKNNQIRLPIDKIDGFLDAVEQHTAAQRPLASWQPYTLKPGESLDHIAARSGSSATEIRQANGLAASTRILAGTRLLAPLPDAKDENQLASFVAPRVYEAVDRPAAYHTVGKTESVTAIAQRYGVTAAAIRTWNNVKASLRRGMTLLVRPASTQTILTTEDGDRQVVSTALRNAVLQPAASSIEAGPLADDARAVHADLRPAAAPSSDPQRSSQAAAPVREAPSYAPPVRSTHVIARSRTTGASATRCRPARRSGCSVAAETRNREPSGAVTGSLRAKSAASGTRAGAPYRSVQIKRAAPSAERPQQVIKKAARPVQAAREDGKREPRA